MKLKIIEIKRWLISILCSIYFIVILFFIFSDGLAKKGSSGVSGFIEQDSLRKSLGDWYQLIFYTFHINIYFTIIGILYGPFYKNNIIKNLFFCSTSYMTFCLFSMFVFSFDSFLTNSYEATKTLFVHFIIPISSFIMLYFIKNDFIIEWNIILINSLYLMLFIIMSLIIYYNCNFAKDTPYPDEPLWIYKFLDYNNQIMFVSTKILFVRIFGIIFVLLITPLISIFLFLFIKNIFRIQIQNIPPKRKNRTL